jgi:hypothetical protein
MLSGTRAVTWSETANSQAVLLHVTHLHYPSSSEACSLRVSRLSRGSLVVARMGFGAGAVPPDPAVL